MTTDPTHRSSLKEFLASIATIRGDLTTITAPPFLLATHSTVSLPSHWASHPSFFLAPATESDPAKRALLVLRWFLASLRDQQYGTGEEGVKKPLNAFLGEVFLAREGETKLVSEQVSHHPPVTACYLFNDEVGIRAEGYACQETSMRTSGVLVKQIGHAILHLDKYDEDYLIPLPDVKVKGLLTGTPYPELEGTYHIIASSGFVAEIDFSGKGLLKGKKNSVDAVLFKEGNREQPLYTVEGQWSEEMRVHKGGEKGEVIETINVNTLETQPLQVENLEKQDDWESGKAWAGVIAALNAGDMQRTVDEKSKIEEAQREMRKLEEEKGVKWEPLFFTKIHDHRDPVLEGLALEPVKEALFSERSGMWKFNLEKWKSSVQKPFHGSLKPNVGKIE